MHAGVIFRAFGAFFVSFAALAARFLSISTYWVRILTKKYEK